MYDSIPFKSSAETKEFLQIVFMILSSMGVLLQFRIDILWLSRYTKLFFAMLDSNGCIETKSTRMKVITIASTAFLFIG